MAEKWRAQGDYVYAVTRSHKHAIEFARDGLYPIVADVMQILTLINLPRVDTVLYAVGYDSRQHQSIEDVYLQGLVNVLNALPHGTGRVIYVSSTGVYGDFRGEWVDESSPCRPVRPGGKACLAAEEALRAHPRGANSTILRMAGIYGPGRVPNKTVFQSGKPLPVSPASWLNLIHVDDAATTVLAAERAVETPRLYIVSDGHPVTREDYYIELARLLHCPPPRFLSNDATWAGPLPIASDKRVSNARLQAELKVEFAYPTYREGLAAVVADRWDKFARE